MSHKLIDKMRRRLADEDGLQPPPWGGRLSVALVYPNTYHHAMSNLGFLSVYQILNSRSDTRCERFFLPDADDLQEHEKTGYPLFSLESGRFLEDFDLIAFSISFENDYLNLPRLFELGRLPLWAAERDDQYPLVLCGGVCAFLNPEPLAEIMDLFAVGEAEVILPELLAHLGRFDGNRDELLESLPSLPGIYVPSQYQVDYHEDGRIAGYSGGAPVQRQWLADLDASVCRSFVQTRETEFGDMSLVEISRGCSRGCRFCAAGYLFLPPRERSFDKLVPQLQEGLEQRKRVGLVSPAVSDHPDIGRLQGWILEQGGEVAVASLRIDSLTAQEVESLKASGHRTVAIAPEAGSQRLRNVINKGLNEEQILDAVTLIAGGGILNLKLYFLIGLPSETEADIDELLELTSRIRHQWLDAQKPLGRLGNLTLSINPFVPKPSTPFQWSAMETEKVLEKRIRKIRSAIARLPNTDVIFESLRSAVLQAFLSRGDRRTARVLPLLSSGKKLPAACRETGLDPAFYVFRQREETEVLPWEILDSGVRREYLWREYQKALNEQLTPPCHPHCHRCGICL